MERTVGAALNLPTDDTVVESRHSNTFLRLKKKLERKVGEAIGDFGMIEDGDVVMVCVSGGKDSFSLLSILLALRERAPISFRIVAMNLDQKQPGFPDHVLPAYFESIGVEYRIVTENTYKIVKDKIPEGKTTCSLCSRLRRGIIYRTAKELGATKIALGHHRDDMIETLFLNMFFGGKMKAMPPKLVSDDGKHVVIRPLAYAREEDIAAYAEARAFPIIPCNLCGSQDGLQRMQIKSLLNEWEKRNPGRRQVMARALPDEPARIDREGQATDMSSTEDLVYTDAYGNVTEEQWQLYRERNVSPADHQELLGVYGHGDAGRVLILAAVREYSRNGQYESYDMIRAAQRRGDGG